MIGHRQAADSELARLADGSLPPAEQAAARARVSASPELARALAEQESVVSRLRKVDEPAPAGLRTRIEAMSSQAPARARRPSRIGFATATAVALAAVVAVVVAMTQPGPAVPTVPQTAQLALAPATTGAPAEDAAHRGSLAVAVDQVSFPYWRSSFGWRAVGTRTDRLKGRRVVTVYYANPSGTRVGYSIVAGPALAASGRVVLVRRGERFNLIRDGGLQIVTWLRSGHTCVLSGRGISERTLLKLATGRAHTSVSA